VPSKNVGARGRCMASPPPIPPKQSSRRSSFIVSLWRRQAGGLVHSMHICVECALLCCDCEGLYKSRVCCREGLPSKSQKPEIWALPMSNGV
jgi:hypothetical protein